MWQMHMPSRILSARLAAVFLIIGCRHAPPVVSAGAPPPRRAPLAAQITDGHSLRSDGAGVYRNGAGGAKVFAAFALTLCVGYENPCGTLPGTARSPDSGRVFLVDLTRPVRAGGVDRGVVRSAQANFGAFWGQDTTRRTSYGGIDGWVLHHTLDLPIATPISSERVELRFFLDGRQHILQLGPWVTGQYQQSQGRLNGAGTTRATLLRTGSGTWVVRAPPGSVARLWDNGNPAAPQDLGLYYFSLEVRFDTVPPAG